MRRQNEGKAAAEQGMSNVIAWCLVAVVLAFVAIVRIRLLAVPLERDEGEFAYMGQLILQGIPPYKLAYSMKAPGIYAAYALMMAAFGQSIAGAHVGLLIVNAAAIVMVFWLGRRLFDPMTGVVACATYAIMSISSDTLGSAAHATHFVVVFALGGILLLLRAMNNRRIAAFFWSGLLFGLAALMKQPGGFFLVFAILYLVWTELRSRPVSRRALGTRSAALIAGAAAPVAAALIVLWASGVLGRFWFWAVDYGREYAKVVPRNEILMALQSGARDVSGTLWPLWLMGIVGLTAIAWDRQVRARGGFLLLLAVCSAAAVSAAFYFRKHYFVMLLPVNALLVGCFVTASSRLAKRAMTVVGLAPTVCFVAALAYAVCAQADYLFSLSPAEVSRRVYWGSFFPEMLEVGKYVRSRAREGDRIAVLGSEPEIYFYTGLHSATGYIYAYPLMEPQKYAHRMQEEMIHEIESARPEFLVLVVTQFTWFCNPDSDTTILRWADRYWRREYTQIGLANMGDPESVVYLWGDEAAYEDPTTDQYVRVLMRREHRGRGSGE